MIRRIAFAVAVLVGIWVLYAQLPSKAVEGHAWTPLPESQFRSFSVDAGGESRKAWNRVASTPSPSILPRASVTPRPTVRPTRTTHSIEGQATWFASLGSWDYGAAGPKLRAAMGPHYLGRFIQVCANGRCVVVKLVTSCACSPDTRLVDLSLDAFSRLASPSLGIIPIEVSW